jgi:hypothetical protein
MQLAGELSKISLPSLIQLVRNGGLTGEISLSQGTNNATIYVETGRVVHVESDVGSGKEGFLELFLWLTGTFSFVESKPADVPRSFPADEPIERILREGVAYLEEKKYLDQLRINGQTILKPTALAKAVKDIPLLERLDGRKTLAQALADANLSRRAYVKAVFQILSEGLVVVSEPVAQGDHVDLPGWVVSRLKQDNPNLSQAIVDMVIWVDRIKCWMYQADADLERVISDLGAGVDDLLSAQIVEPVSDFGAREAQPPAPEPKTDSAQGEKGEAKTAKDDATTTPAGQGLAEPPARAARPAYAAAKLVEGSAGAPIPKQASSTNPGIASSARLSAKSPALPARPGVSTPPLAQPPAASTLDSASSSGAQVSSGGPAKLIAPSASSTTGAKPPVYAPAGTTGIPAAVPPEQLAPADNWSEPLPTAGAAAPLAASDQSAPAEALPSWAEPTPPVEPKLGSAVKTPSFTVARATPLPPPPGSGRASDLFKQRPAVPSAKDAGGSAPSKPAEQFTAVEAGPEPEVAKEDAKPAEDAAKPEEEKPVPAATDPPQAIPRAPWTRAAMARKGFLGGSSSGAKPSVPPRSIEF